eukprot:jgi/Mesvir1/6018/Mv00763-RA.1
MSIPRRASSVSASRNRREGNESLVGRTEWLLSQYPPRQEKNLTPRRNVEGSYVRESRWAPGSASDQGRRRSTSEYPSLLPITVSKDRLQEAGDRLSYLLANKQARPGPSPCPGASKAGAPTPDAPGRYAGKPAAGTAWPIHTNTSAAEGRASSFYANGDAQQVQSIYGKRFEGISRAVTHGTYEPPFRPAEPLQPPSSEPDKRVGQPVRDWASIPSRQQAPPPQAPLQSTPAPGPQELPRAANAAPSMPAGTSSVRPLVPQQQHPSSPPSTQQLWPAPGAEEGAAIPRDDRPLPAGTSASVDLDLGLPSGPPPWQLSQGAGGRDPPDVSGSITMGGDKARPALSPAGEARGEREGQREGKWEVNRGREKEESQEGSGEGKRDREKEGSQEGSGEGKRDREKEGSHEGSGEGKRDSGREGSRGGLRGADRDRDRDRLVTVHVVDEASGCEKDFPCSLNVLVREMRYLVSLGDLLASHRPGAEVGITVHCDVAVFHWLLTYANADPAVRPSPDVDNCLPLLISSDFLRMPRLVGECARVVADHIHQIATLPLDLSCLSERVLQMVAFNVDVATLERVHRGRGDEVARASTVEKGESPSGCRDALVSKMYKLKLASLLRRSDVQLRRCRNCTQIYLEGASESLLCLCTDVVIDRNGQPRARHVALPDWRPRAYLNALYARKRSWRGIYWHIWGTLLTFACALCGEVFRAKDLRKCRFHPQPAAFRFGCQEGLHSCCQQRALLSHMVGLPAGASRGCCVRQHKPTPRVLVGMAVQPDGSLGPAPGLSDPSKHGGKRPTSAGLQHSSDRSTAGKTGGDGGGDASDSWQQDGDSGDDESPADASTSMADVFASLEEHADIIVHPFRRSQGVPGGPGGGRSFPVGEDGLDTDPNDWFAVGEAGEEGGLAPGGQRTARGGRVGEGEGDEVEGDDEEEEDVGEEEDSTSGNELDEFTDEDESQGEENDEGTRVDGGQGVQGGRGSKGGNPDRGAHKGGARTRGASAGMRRVHSGHALCDYEDDYEEEIGDGDGYDEEEEMDRGTERGRRTSRRPASGVQATSARSSRSHSRGRAAAAGFEGRGAAEAGDEREGAQMGGTDHHSQGHYGGRGEGPVPKGLPRPKALAHILSSRMVKRKKGGTAGHEKWPGGSSSSQPATPLPPHIPWAWWSWHCRVDRAPGAPAPHLLCSAELAQEDDMRRMELLMRELDERRTARRPREKLAVPNDGRSTRPVAERGVSARAAGSVAQRKPSFGGS